MIFGQLIEYTVRNICLQKWGRETCSRSLFFFLKKLYIRSEQFFSTLVLKNVGRSLIGHTIKTNCSITFCWSRDMLSFDFVQEPETNLHTTFCVWFFKKNIFHVILLTDQISLSGSLYFLIYWAMCILIVCFPARGVIDFEIKRFFYINL